MPVKARTATRRLAGRRIADETTALKRKLDSASSLGRWLVLSSNLFSRSNISLKTKKFQNNCKSCLLSPAFPLGYGKTTQTSSPRKAGLSALYLYISPLRLREPNIGVSVSLYPGEAKQGIPGRARQSEQPSCTVTIARSPDLASASFSPRKREKRQAAPDQVGHISTQAPDPQARAHCPSRTLQARTGLFCRGKVPDFFHRAMQIGRCSASEGMHPFPRTYTVNCLALPCPTLTPVRSKKHGHRPILQQQVQRATGLRRC